MEDKEQKIKDAIEEAENSNAYEGVEHQTGMIDLEEEFLEEEEVEIQDSLETDILDLPLPEIVEENVQLQTDGRNFSNLSSFEKIKFAAAQNGVAVKKPKQNCKYCHGTGVISTKIIKTETPTSSGDTSGTEIIEEVLPNPCRCIFKKEDLPKMFTGKILMSRILERKQNKDFQKKNLKKTNAYILEQIRLKKKKKDKKKSKKKMKKKFGKR